MVQPRLLSLVAASIALGGCAAQKQAPFHVYQSPLLAAQTETPRPTDRTFDPASPGDFPDVNDERIVAENSNSSWESVPQEKEEKEPAVANRAERRKAKPALSATRKGVGGRGGASSSSAEVGELSPARAAAYVHKTLEVNGVHLPTESRTSIPVLWDECKSRGKAHQGDPLPGDAAFFHNAFDANSDGRNNDWYTHVGVVESVDQDGTVVVLSWFGGKVDRISVNPRRPDESEANGRTINSRIRRPTADDAPFTQYYAGQLFAGWCTLLDGKRDVVVIDSWRPE